MNRDWSRRDVLKLFAATPVLGCTRPVPPPVPARDPKDELLLDEIQRASFAYFWDEASPATGQVKDRALANGNDKRSVASVAATGFGLTALCIADRRRYRRHDELAQRTLATLQFLAQYPHEHGFYYHFIDMNTGARMWNSELSSIDSALLFVGVLTARQHFPEPQIRDLATKIYERVDWPWMLNGGELFSMGWTPEKGFIDTRWEHYCELMMIYLLAYGSPTHPVPPASWSRWRRPTNTYDGITYISSGDPLFTHQFSHAWFDFKGKRDAFADYYDNSVKATEAHKRFCIAMRDKFPTYSSDLWGITASDSEHGYTAWGGPPATGQLDGSVVPCAAGGSLPFAFDDCMRVLRTLRTRYADKVWTKYSFVDAFNPVDGWANPDVIGIDIGITMVMAENARTGFVWDTFMKNPEAQLGMQRAGFHAA